MITCDRKYCFLFVNWLVCNFWFLLFSFQQGISFSGISLSSVQLGAFCGLRSLEELDLSNNNLTIAPELLPVKPTLQKLKLGENKIHDFPSDYFDGYDDLQYVDIRNNILYSVPNMGFVGHSLDILLINHNKLKTLDEKLTGGLNMTVLERLLASGNEIQHINVAILGQMPKLTRLDLGENQLRHLADPSAYLPHGRTLDLSLHLNPLTCDKALSWLLVLFEQGMIEKHVGNRAECHHPPCLQGRHIMSLSKCPTH